MLCCLAFSLEKDLAASSSLHLVIHLKRLAVSCCQAKIERAQIVLNRSQPALPRSTGSASPVFGRTPNAGLKSSIDSSIDILTVTDAY